MQGCARGLFSLDRFLESRGRGVDNSSRGETEIKAFRARDRDESEAYQLWGETEPRHYHTSRRPQDRGIKTEATSHIHTIPRTDVVLKRSGGSLELRLNWSGIFKHNFIYVMLKCLPTRLRRLLPRPRPRLQCQDRGQDQDVQSRGRGETKAFEISTEARPSRDTTTPREGLETEASRLRPHPCKYVNQRQCPHYKLQHANGLMILLLSHRTCPCKKFKVMFIIFLRLITNISSKCYKWLNGACRDSHSPSFLASTNITVSVSTFVKLVPPGHIDSCLPECHIIR